MTKLLYRVSEAGEQCSLGRTKTYELINRGRIRAVKVDGTLRVPRSAIEEFVGALEAKSAPSGEVSANLDERP
jgi:excisionase family DNA binding protein